MIQRRRFEQGERADLPDMMTDILQTNFERLTSRAVDRDDNGYHTAGLGGHLLSGFAIDVSAGLANTTIGAGTFLDTNGLPIAATAESIDISAHGALTSCSLWIRWSLLPGSLAVRKKLVAGVKTSPALNTREDTTVSVTSSVNFATPPAPPVTNAWVYMGDLVEVGGGTLAAPVTTIMFQPNAVWDAESGATGFGRNYEHQVKVAAEVAEDVVGFPLYATADKMRRVLSDFLDDGDPGAGGRRWDDYDQTAERSLYNIEAALDGLGDSHLVTRNIPIDRMRSVAGGILAFGTGATDFSVALLGGDALLYIPDHTNIDDMWYPAMVTIYAQNSIGAAAKTADLYRIDDPLAAAANMSAFSTGPVSWLAGVTSAQLLFPPAGYPTVAPNQAEAGRPIVIGFSVTALQQLQVRAVTVTYTRKRLGP